MVNLGPRAVVFIPIGSEVLHRTVNVRPEGKSL